MFLRSNPPTALDLGPRLFSALAGWGSLPFEVNGAGWWTVYLLAPILGGLLGGGLYTLCFKPAYVAAPHDAPSR